MLSSLLADQHVDSIAGVHRNLARSDYDWDATSIIYDTKPADICRFTLGFFNRVSDYRCFEGIGDDFYWPLINGSSCCVVNSTDSKEALDKAIKFLFMEDYFFAVEAMILWWRKAMDDLASCPANKITDLGQKLQNRLDAERAREGYFDDIVAGIYND